MKFRKIVFINCLFILFVPLVSADYINNYWISYPTANTTSYGVYHFRKSFELDRVPEVLLADISADNRYQLFINGQQVCYGPAKGDLKTYKYDEIDIAPWLKEGENVIAALVFNMGEEKPMAFISAQTAFLFYCYDDNFAFLNSDNSWKTMRNNAYDPVSYGELATWKWVKGYYACGPADEVYAEKYPWGWETINYDDSMWKNAEKLSFDKEPHWRLAKRSIPFMDDYREKPDAIRRVTGLNLENVTPDNKLIIPPNSHATVLYDFGIFTMGYPELRVNRGKKSKIKIRYAEALYEKPDLKAHRDSVRGLTMYGIFDIFHNDGEERMFRPIWKRAFRYLELEIVTDEESLEIISLENEYSAYPYPEKATFKSDDPMLDKIFVVGQRTLEMCSAETYYDTPYYEQMSYGGDNRPIGANSFYNSTDDRLFREVMRIYPQSANVETHLFKAAYPSRFRTDMGTWSMAWVQSLLDYYKMRGDKEFVKQFIPEVEGVLEFHSRRIDENNYMLGEMDNRNFIDWSIHRGSVPQIKPNVAITHSAMLTLYYVHTLDCAAEVYNAIGEKEKASQWKALADKIRSAVFENCWDEEKDLVADYPDKRSFSQQTNILGLLCDVVPENTQNQLLENILTYPEFDEVASSYFTFFLFMAMEKIGREELFLKNLDFWKTFINRGHTTFGETGFASHDRSDCHAWSSHPTYYLLRFIAGIKPGEAGFKSVMIEPHPGDLKTLRASMPHPEGKIQVDYQIKNNSLKGTIVLPGQMKGIFRMAGEEIKLESGENEVSLEF